MLMSRSLANSLYGLLVILSLVFFWGPLSRWLEDTLHMDAVAAFVTTIALIAIMAAITVRFVRQRL
jgi:hypothetical protein